MKFLLLIGIICGLHIANSHGSSNIVLSTQKPKTESVDYKKSKRDALIDPYQQYYHQHGAYNFREHSVPVAQATKYNHPSVQHVAHSAAHPKITAPHEIPPTALPLHGQNVPNLYEEHHPKTTPHYTAPSSSEYSSDQHYNTPASDSKYVSGLQNYQIDQFPQYENAQSSPQISSYNPAGNYHLTPPASTPHQNYQYGYAHPQILSAASQTHINGPKNVIASPTTAYTQGNPALGLKYPANFHTVQSHPNLLKVAGNPNESPVYHSQALGHHQIQGFTAPLSPHHQHQNPHVQFNGYPGAVTQHLGYGTQPNGKLIYQNGKFVFQQYPSPAIKMLAPNNNYRNVPIRYVNNAPSSAPRMPLYSKHVDKTPQSGLNGREVHRPRPKQYIDNTKERHENDRVSEDEEDDRESNREVEHDHVRYRKEEDDDDDEEESPKYKVEKGFRPSRYYEQRYDDSDEEDYRRSKQEKYRHNDDDDEEEGRHSSKYTNSSEEDEDDDDSHRGAASSYGTKYDRKPYYSKYKGKYALGSGKKFKRPNYDYKYPYSKGNGYEKYTTIKYATPTPKLERIEGRYSSNIPVTTEHERKHYQADWFVTSVKS